MTAEPDEPRPRPTTVKPVALAAYPLAQLTRWIAYHERRSSPAPAVVTPKSDV